MKCDEPFFRIDLEDYASPRYSSTTRPYYGTKQDIQTVLFELSLNSHTRIRYGETIEAFKVYDRNPNATHHMAGVEFPILTSMTHVHRQNFVMSDKDS